MNRRPTDRVQLQKTPGYEEIVERVAANVRRLREARGWTQEDAAHRCAGLHVTLYRTVEGGRTNITATTLARLCAGFEVDVKELFEPAPPLVRRKRGRPPKIAPGDATRDPSSQSESTHGDEATPAEK